MTNTQTEFKVGQCWRTSAGETLTIISIDQGYLWAENDSGHRNQYNFGGIYASLGPRPFEPIALLSEPEEPTTTVDIKPVIEGDKPAGLKLEVGKQYVDENDAVLMVTKKSPDGHFMVCLASYPRFYGLYESNGSLRRDFSKTKDAIKTLVMKNLVSEYTPPLYPREVWLNVSKDENGRLFAHGAYLNKSLAEIHHTANIVGCNKITLRAEFDDEGEA